MRKHLLGLVLSAVPALALANGYNVPNTNARDLGMADSARAAQFSAAATYANPAALAGLEGLNLSIGISLLDLRTDWSADDAAAVASGLPSGGSNSMDFHPVTPPALFVSYGGKLGDRGWGVGAGWNVVAGGNVFWPANWQGRSRIIQVDRKVHAFYLTGGFELIKQVKIGGGLVYYRTTEDLIQSIRYGTTAEGNAELVASGGALSFDASALITPVDGFPLTIGVDYKHQGVQTLEGNVHFFDVPPAFATNQLTQDQAVTHRLTIPNYLNVALAFKATPTLLLTTGFTWDRYEVYQEDRFEGSRGASVVVPRNYSNGYTFRAGAEYEWTPRLTVRGGILRDVSGLDTNAYSPTLPDSNAWALGLGGSWLFTPDLGLDLAIWGAKLDEVSATNTGPSPQAMAGTYNSHVLIYSLAVTWHPL